MEDSDETLVLNYIDDDSVMTTTYREPEDTLLRPNKFDGNQNSNQTATLTATNLFPKSVLAKPKELDDIPDADDEDEDIPKELIVILEKELLKPSSNLVASGSKLKNHQFASPKPPAKDSRGRPSKSEDRSKRRLQSFPFGSRVNSSGPLEPLVKIESADDSSDDSNVTCTTPATNSAQKGAREVVDSTVKYETDIEQALMHTEFKYESHSESEEVIRRKQALYVASLNNRSEVQIERIKKFVQEKLKNSGEIEIKASRKPRKSTGHVRTKGLTKLSIFKCKHCLYVGKSRANLQRHNLLHTDPNQIEWFKCTHCSYQSKYLFQLKSHMVMHKDPDEIEYQQCPYCDFKTARKQNLKQHIKSLHSNLENSFKCAICPYSTISKDRLMAHIKTHSKEVFTCKLCKFMTKTETYLKNHIKYIHCTIEKPFMCDTCSYKSKTGRELDRHYMRMHNKDQLVTHQCPMCSFRSIYKKNLNFHMTRIHGNPDDCPKFICGHCNKEFAYKSGLKVHIVRVHLKLPEDEWQKCPECKYKSKCVNTLKRHIKRNHGAPRLHCDKCNFATNRLTSMRAHAQSHIKGNNAAYVCPECPYRITLAQSFIYHMKATHERTLNAKDINDYYMEDKPQIKGGKV